MKYCLKTNQKAYPKPTYKKLSLGSGLVLVLGFGIVCTPLGKNIVGHRNYLMWLVSDQSCRKQKLKQFCPFQGGCVFAFFAAVPGSRGGLTTPIPGIRGGILGGVAVLTATPGTSHLLLRFLGSGSPAGVKVIACFE